MKKIFLCLFTLSCFPVASGMEPVTYYDSFFDDYFPVNEKPPLNQQLAEAAKAGNCDLVATCLEQGADVNSTQKDLSIKTLMYYGTPSDLTPLMYAVLYANDAEKTSVAWENRKKTCRKLIEARANVNVTATIGGRSALMCAAARYSNLDLAYLLLKAGAQIDQKSTHNQNALIIAALRHDEALCEMLVKHHRKTSPGTLTQLLETQEDFHKKRAYDYCQLDCLNPDLIKNPPKSSIARNEELLRSVLAQDQNIRQCPSCAFTYLFEAPDSELLANAECPGCPTPICESVPQKVVPAQFYTPNIAANPVAGARLELAFAPDLPGFYHMENNSPYRYDAGSCGINALFTMARLEAEIFGRNFSEDEFRQAQKAMIPDFADGTRVEQRVPLATRLKLAPLYEIWIDNGIIQIRSPGLSFFWSFFSSPVTHLDENINKIVTQLRQSNGAFVAHFMCRVPEHVFAISITRNANNEQAMYLHDGLNTQAEDASDMHRYIKFLYSRFF